MTKLLILHGKGMELRGTVDIEIYGTMKLPEYDERIKKYASEVGREVEIFHSNEEADVIKKIEQAGSDEIDAVLINPAGYTTGYPSLVETIKQASIPTFEIHMSNPANRGRSSEIATACKGTIAGFGIIGYALGMKGALDAVGK